MTVRKTLAACAIGAFLTLANAVPAFAEPASQFSTITHQNRVHDVGQLCNFGTYGDLSALCAPDTGNDPRLYCYLGTVGDFTVLCDTANLNHPRTYLNLGNYGDFGQILDGLT